MFSQNGIMLMLMFGFYKSTTADYDSRYYLFILLQTNSLRHGSIMFHKNIKKQVVIRIFNQDMTNNPLKSLIKK